MQINNIENFTSLSQFTSLKEFNSHMEQWALDVKELFTPSQYIALRRLIKFSCKHFGICTAKIGTLVKATYENNDMGGISRSTFKRAIAKAKELGLLKVHESTRQNGSQSSNIYVFNRYQSQDEPPKSEQLNHQENSQPSKTSNLINKRKANFDHSYVSSNVPESFVNTVRPFFSRPKDIYKVYSKLTLAIRKHGTESLKISHINELCKTFKEAIYRYKNRSIKADIYGYLYGSFSNKVRELTMEQNAKGKGVYYDWLEPTHEQSL